MLAQACEGMASQAKLRLTSCEVRGRISYVMGAPHGDICAEGLEICLHAPRLHKCFLAPSVTSRLKKPVRSLDVTEEQGNIKSDQCAPKCKRWAKYQIDPLAREKGRKYKIVLPRRVTLYLGYAIVYAS